MAASGDESGMADDHAPYPLPGAWVQVRLPQLYLLCTCLCMCSWLGFGLMCRSQRDPPVRREVDSGPPLRQA